MLLKANISIVKVCQPSMITIPLLSMASKVFMVILDPSDSHWHSYTKSKIHSVWRYFTPMKQSTENGSKGIRAAHWSVSVHFSNSL